MDLALINQLCEHVLLSAYTIHIVKWLANPLHYPNKKLFRAASL